jgi:glutathione S-transferase
VILYYLDEAFPTPPLMPREPLERMKVRMVNKLIDEYVHNACVILTFGTAFRPWFAGLSAEQIDQRLAKSPLKKRSEYKRDVALHGLESKFAQEAFESYGKLLKLIDEAGGGWLAGGAFSLADAAAVPYVLRLDLLKMAKLWDGRPGVAAWYKRVLARPSVRSQMLDRMTPEDHAPFKALS